MNALKMFLQIVAALVSWFLVFFLHGFFGGTLLVSIVTIFSFMWISVSWELGSPWLSILIFVLSGMYFLSISWSLGPLLFFALLFSIISVHGVSMVASHVNPVTGFMSSHFLGSLVLTILVWYVLKFPFWWGMIGLGFLGCSFFLLAKLILDRSSLPRTQ